MVQGLPFGFLKLRRSRYNSPYKAKLFKAGNSYKKAIEALKELIICNEKLLEYFPSQLSNWAVARNYEEMLEIYVNHLP